jgi:hypothetical protein
MEPKGTIIIRPHDILYYMVGSFIVSLVCSFFDTELRGIVLLAH